MARQPWYGSAAYPTAQDPASDGEGTNSAIPETTSLFLMAALQYVAVAAVCCRIYPPASHRCRPSAAAVHL